MAVYRRVSLVVACLVCGVTMLLGWLSAPGLARSPASQPQVIISEVAWQGTAANFRHEWIELHNTTSSPINLQGWLLTDGADINIYLSGVIPAHGFHLLEQASDQSISDIPAGQIYLGVLSDAGEPLLLKDGNQAIIDSANSNGGSWPAGSGSPTYRSMERQTPASGSGEDGWISNDTITRNGYDANFGPINGTPGQPNSSWASVPPAADLAILKTGPDTVKAGEQLPYTLIISNIGQAAATDVEVIDVLPEGLEFFEDSGLYPHQQPVPGTLIWQLGTMLPGSQVTLQLTTTLNYDLSGWLDNQVQVNAIISEPNMANNQAQVSTLVVPITRALVLIKAVHFSGYEDDQPDEAVKIYNVGGATADLSGWIISDNEGQAIFPEGANLLPKEDKWIAREATSFSRQFGFDPDYEIKESNATVPNLSGGGPRFADYGDEVLLYDSTGFLQDALVYLDGDTGQSGWSGPAVEPYILSGNFGAKGQILYRLTDQSDGLPVVDTNTAADWAQSDSDKFSGKRIQYPGWDLDTFFFSPAFIETAEVIVGVAPDNAFNLLVQEIRQAKQSLEIEALTFRSWPIALELTSAANRGVEVTVLLEGDPPTGIDDQEKYICQQLEAAGGSCWFMISKPDDHIYDRYRYLHAKFIIIDQKRVIISSENLSPDSLPNDPKGDGTLGRRGLMLATNAPSVVGRIRAIWLADYDPANHVDLFRWSAQDPKYGDPPPETAPITENGGSSYKVRYPSPWRLSGSFTTAVSQSPENSLRDQDGILYLINNSGPGDTILLQQLSERPHWGPGASNAIDDPNPRLEAVVAAARRGASVRLLLDEFFDRSSDPLGNHVTCRTINQTARIEQLDLRCARANPTGLGIHNKMILIEVDGHGYSFVGSLNGTELSHKGNREAALLLGSDDLYNLLAQLFFADWPYRKFLPIFYYQYLGPADHLLISEVYYDPPGTTEDDEFIEIVNPTHRPIQLDGFSLGDATRREDFEDVRRFPPGTVLEANETVVVATTAAGFQERFGSQPDFEIQESDPFIPNLIDDPGWGDPAAILRLGNSGDELYLRDFSGRIVDALAYGSGQVAGQPSCPLLAGSGRSLERYPFWRDRDNCPADFRDWPLPNPGLLP